MKTLRHNFLYFSFLAGIALLQLDFNAFGQLPNGRLPAYAAEVDPLAVSDWPQLGRDAQRTNYSPQQVDPPYCYTWKWYEVHFASRAQPVVADGRLFIGGMNGVMYARNASTGAPIWSYAVNSPIRHSAGVMNNTVVFSTQAGHTYALRAATGTRLYRPEFNSAADGCNPCLGLRCLGKRQADCIAPLRWGAAVGTRPWRTNLDLAILECRWADRLRRHRGDPSRGT